MMCRYLIALALVVLLVVPAYATSGGSMGPMLSEPTVDIDIPPTSAPPASEPIDDAGESSVAPDEPGLLPASSETAPESSLVSMPDDSASSAASVPDDLLSSAASSVADSLGSSMADSGSMSGSMVTSASASVDAAIAVDATEYFSRMAGLQLLQCVLTSVIIGIFLMRMYKR